jgi:hypothetical protein
MKRARLAGLIAAWLAMAAPAPVAAAPIITAPFVTVGVASIGRHEAPQAGAAITQASSPSAAMKAFYTAAKKKDIDGLKRVICRASLKAIEKEVQKDAPELSGEFLLLTVDYFLMMMADDLPAAMPETRNEKISGNRATLEVESGKNGEWEIEYFVKEDGEWKVALDMAHLRG